MRTRILSVLLSLVLLWTLVGCSTNTNLVTPSTQTNTDSEVRVYSPFHPETDTYTAYDLATAYSSDDNPVVRLFFEDGSWLTIELYPTLAPLAVQRFLKMAKDGWLEGTAIHSVEKDYLVCGGAIEYSATGYPMFSDTSDYPPIAAECAANGYDNDLLHEFGVIGFCLNEGDYNSVEAQYYICTTTLSEFDGYSPAFGRIVGDESGDKLNQLNSLATEEYNSALPCLPLEPQTILMIDIDYGKYTFLGDRL